jgi:hypothetical protein
MTRLAQAGSRVEGVAQAIAQEVKREHSDEDKK